MIDASARPALAQTLEMEVAVQEYCVAAAREMARDAEPVGNSQSLNDVFGAGTASTRPI